MSHEFAICFRHFLLVLLQYLDKHYNSFRLQQRSITEKNACRMNAAKMLNKFCEGKAGFITCYLFLWALGFALLLHLHRRALLPTPLHLPLAGSWTALLFSHLPRDEKSEQTDWLLGLSGLIHSYRLQTEAFFLSLSAAFSLYHPVYPPNLLLLPTPWL